MYKLKHIKLTNLLGSVCSLALLAIGLMAIVPNVTEGANAEEITRLNAKITPVMSIALTNSNIDIELTPTESSASSTGSTTVTVNTNNSTGYALYLSALDSDPNLINTKNGVDKIAPMVGSELSTNTWGYSLAKDDSIHYQAIPSASTAVDNQPTRGVTSYNLSFGVKVDSTLPAGTYSGKVAVSAVANPVELYDMLDLTYMQDIKPEYCANTHGTDGKLPVTPGNEPSVQLTDSRDGKKYWVSKLADQNCWMAQNLALDIPKEGLKAVDTDIESDWNASSTYPPTVTETEVPKMIANGGPVTATRSWNLGEYVLLNPTDGTVCSNTSGTKSDSITDDGLNSVWAGGNLDNCNRLEKWNGTQDAHYLIGNYYQWNTATAGSGGEIVSGGTEGDNNSFVPNNAKDSICPKNWQLPSADSGVARSAGDIAKISDYDTKYGKTFTKLFTAYGYNLPNGNVPDIHGSNGQNGHNTASIPFYFSRTGNIDPSTGSLRVVGYASYAWSSTATVPASNAYRLGSDSAVVVPSFSTDRWFGFPIRCLAR